MPLGPVQMPETESGTTMSQSLTLRRSRERSKASLREAGGVEGGGRVVGRREAESGRRAAALAAEYRHEYCPVKLDLDLRHWCRQHIYI